MQSARPGHTRKYEGRAVAQGAAGRLGAGPRDSRSDGGEGPGVPEDVVAHH